MRDTARVFNWMRPNDLIRNYVAASYLHGDPLPSFDILYWNNDTTRLPARLHGDFLDFFKSNPFASAGRLAVHGLPIDLGKVTRPVFIVGGTTDQSPPGAPATASPACSAARARSCRAAAATSRR